MNKKLIWKLIWDLVQITIIQDNYSRTLIQDNQQCI